jgi:hypothetical protein
VGEIESAILSCLQFALEQKLEAAEPVPLITSVISPLPVFTSKNCCFTRYTYYKLLKLQIDEANFVCKCGSVLERRRLIMHVTLGGLKMRHAKSVDFQHLTIFFEGESGGITFYRSKLTPEGTFHTPMVEMPLRSSAV